MAIQLQSMTITTKKQLFSLPEDIHYLNNATLGPLNIKSEEAGIEAIMIGRNPLRRTRDQFFDPVEESRKLFGKLVNAPAEQIAIIPSTSYGVATVAKNLTINRGEEILVLEDQFPSNYYIWKELCDANDAKLITIAAPDSSARSAAWTTAIIEGINPNTKIVAIANVHWMDGTYYDLEAISARCRQYGCYLIIDGTQSVGALPFDVAKIQPDALIVSGYKWLLGPYGLGFAYYGHRLLGGSPLEANWINKERSFEFENLTSYTDAYRPGAARYSMGEQSSFIAIPMANAALRLLNEWDPAQIQSYAKSLTDDAWSTLQAEGISIDADKPSYHMTGLRFNDRWDMQLLQDTLSKKNIVVSRRGSALRISVNIYNEPRDIDALVNTIISLKK